MEWEGEGLVCIIHGVSPSTLNEVGEGLSFTMSLSAPWMEVEGDESGHLHSQCASSTLGGGGGGGGAHLHHTLSGGGGGAHLHHTLSGGGAHLHHPQWVFL